MRLGNKGQGAMEYLMTYGWAILVVMIVGVVLWQLGIFQTGPGSATATGFSKVKPLNPGEIEVASASASGAGDGTFDAVFVNAAGGTITLNGAAITFTAPNSGVCTTITANTTSGLTADLTANEELTVPQGGTFAVTSTDCDAYGGRYTATMNLTYSMEVGGFQRARTEVGTISGPLV